MAINWNNIEAVDNSAQITALEFAIKDGEIGRMEKLALGQSQTWKMLVDTYGGNELKASQMALKLAENTDLAQIESYIKSKGLEFNAGDFADDFFKLEESGELDNFLNRIKTDPDYKTQLAETLENNPSAISSVIAQHSAAPAPFQPDANDSTPTDAPTILDSITDIIPSVDNGNTEPEIPIHLRPAADIQANEETNTSDNGAAAPAAGDVEAYMQIAEFMDQHVEANPQDTALAEHFMSRIAPGPNQDPQLVEALRQFKANNGDLLKADSGDGDDLMAGFMDKDAMIHDLLDSYKKTPDKAYEALANPDFQNEAFMQYSSIGQAVSMIATPILNWLGSLFGQDSTLSGWAQMDFSAIMQDFQSFFNGGMNNAMAMSNNDMSLTGAISTVFNVGIGAGQDALEMTRYDRQYTQDNPNTPVQNTVALIQDDGTVDTITLGDAPDSNAEQNAAAELQLQQQRDNQNNLNNTTQQPAGPPQ